MSITALVLSTNTNSNTNDIDSDNNISLYPNPAKEFFYVNSNKMISKIEIYNTLGVIEKQIKSTNGDKMIKISTDDLTQSVYYVKIYTSTDIITKQIIIK